ncbi:MAG: hypothetical protein M3O74_05565 [Pseudomonadota bacterium]|nr:hypothetical protein [Pseudomonadota bacterium]
MEMKQGYKQTEGGAIPEDWGRQPLKGLVSISHGFAFASKYFASNGLYRLTTPGHFYEKGGFRHIGEKQKFYTGQVPSDYVLEAGDLIVAMTEQADGLLGSTAFISENEPKRLALYKFTAAFIRAYASLVNELEEAGYTSAEIATLKAETIHFENARNEVKLNSGDYIDLKMYEPAMRHLIDTYIRAEESEKLSAFDDLSLIQLIVERGASAVDELPKGIRESKEAVAETIENNVRKLIIDEQPINPKYYEKMSELLDSLIEKRKTDAVAYGEYLAEIVELAKKAKNPATGASYPAVLDTAAKRALYDNLGKNEALAVDLDQAVRNSSQDEWRNNPMKIKKVRIAIKAVLGGDEALTDKIFDLVKNQHDY